MCPEIAKPTKAARDEYMLIGGRPVHANQNMDTGNRIAAADVNHDT
jgi:hypothetical protein